MIFEWGGCTGLVPLALRCREEYFPANASRELRLEFKPHHRVLFGTSKGFFSTFRRFFLIFHLQNFDFASPIEKMPFGPVGPVWPGGAVTDIVSACATCDLRLESKPHHRILFGPTKGFVIMFCRFLDILPPNFRFLDPH